MKILFDLFGYIFLFQDLAQNIITKMVMIEYVFQAEVSMMYIRVLIHKYLTNILIDTQAKHPHYKCC